MSEFRTGGTVDAATLPPRGAGRIFEGIRPVRLADAHPSGRLRLDALARHLQDVATDDVVDAQVGDGGITWVVRRTALVVEQWPRYLERVTYSTFCSGTGPRWADRRTSAWGRDGGHIEAAMLWASVDRSGRPARLPAGFDRVWGATAGGRTVSARLLHPPVPEGLTGRPWQLRTADLDILGHVNNAVYWAAVEDELARLAPDSIPLAAECEYRVPLEVDDEVTRMSRTEGSTVRTWVVSPRGVHASAWVRTQ